MYAWRSSFQRSFSASVRAPIFFLYVSLLPKRGLPILRMLPVNWFTFSPFWYSARTSSKVALDFLPARRLPAVHGEEPSGRATLANVYIFLALEEAAALVRREGIGLGLGRLD